MSSHVFEVGSIVALNSDGRPAPLASHFVVEAQMPPVGAFLQYRIKSESEGFRRVVPEHQLSSFTTAERPPSPLPRPHHGEED